jgi:hypothetical protein
MSDLRSLIEAAKADAPSAAARTKVWAGVSSAVGEAAALAGGAGSGAATATGSVSAAKMLVLGTLFGGTLAVGIGAAMLYVGRVQPAARTVMIGTAPARAEGTQLVAIAVNDVAPARPVLLDTVVDPMVNAAPAPVAAVAARPLGVRMAAAAPVEPSRKAPAEHAAADRALGARGAGGSLQDDTLAREASLLAEARKALVRSDALSALQIVRGLRSLPERQLVPEELTVEAQALRGLGLDDDAKVVETTLRERFPDSVLGR